MGPDSPQSTGEEGGKETGWREEAQEEWAWKTVSTQGGRVQTHEADQAGLPGHPTNSPQRGQTGQHTARPTGSCRSAGTSQAPSVQASRKGGRLPGPAAGLPKQRAQSSQGGTPGLREADGLSTKASALPAHRMDTDHNSRTMRS